MFLEHVNISVVDLDRSVDFYRRLFGFRVRWKGENSKGWPAAHVGDEKTYVALFQPPAPETVAQDYETIGLNHYGFVVEDLEEVKRRLGEMGVEPHLEADYDPGRRIYFYDPDGVEIELSAYDPV
ncbi:MAG: VOC family protein [Pirellulaceae bacterium]|jgi:catechol 2,3-dioxygenase-like lactoylglutathione lyase family enzyme|nr:VOC family protein [Pirellulaceae bacterium]MDP7015967.1 VOC family protein [Pirellulaceae bacterium]